MSSLSASAQAGPPPARMGFVVLYALAFFATYLALLTPPVMTLALRVAEVAPERKEAVLSMALGLGAIVAMLANPLAGLLSDCTTSRLGMRRPWILAGLVVGVLGLYLIAVGGVPLIVAGWCVAQLGFNMLLAALLAVLPDQVPEAQRGRVAGVLGICLQLGIVAGVYLAQAASPDALKMFMLPALVAVALVLLFVVTFKDRQQAPGSHGPLDVWSVCRSFWIDPRTAPDFYWAFASRFMFFMGLATLLSYQVYLLLDKLHLPSSSVPQAMLTSTLVTTGTTVLGSLASGWLSDRTGRRRVFVLVAALIYGLGLAVIGTAADFNAFLWGIAVCGLGQGVYLAVDLALVTEVLPNQGANAAKDLGLFNLASALPQTLAPALAPLFLGIGAASGVGNYSALFIAAAAFAATGAFCLLPIRGVK